MTNPWGPAPERKRVLRNGEPAMWHFPLNPEALQQYMTAVQGYRSTYRKVLDKHFSESDPLDKMADRIWEGIHEVEVAFIDSLGPISVLGGKHYKTMNRHGS
ncbi:hypothetical protein KIPB_007701, partial [Kipferlia bialata]|eukprot:g7701.t1